MCVKFNYCEDILHISQVNGKQKNRNIFFKQMYSNPSIYLPLLLSAPVLQGPPADYGHCGGCVRYRHHRGAGHPGGQPRPGGSSLYTSPTQEKEGRELTFSEIKESFSSPERSLKSDR